MTFGPVRLPAAGMPRPHIRGLVLAELAAFLFLILPSLLLSYSVAETSGIGFPLAASAIILRDLALVFLILYFLRRNGESLRRIGWRGRHIFRETMLGLALYIPTFLGTMLLSWLLQWMKLSSPGRQVPSALAPAGAWEMLLAVALVFVVAIAEETIFRGYLILRFRMVTRSLPLAVVISCGLFAVGHGYEGVSGVILVGYLGVVFALVYLWRGSVVAPAAMHFVQDFLGIVLLPLLLQ